jgi:uncharacterized RmlC-like cupin family protein
MATIAARHIDDVDTEDHCMTIRPGRMKGQSKQGHEVFEGISAESVGARGLCLHVIVIPAGARARAHLHEDHESAIYMAEGEVLCWYGDRLQHQFTVRKGEMAYIPAGVPHLPINTSDSEQVTCIIARTDPNEQESVVLLPDLEQLPHVRPVRSGVVVELASARH